MSSAYLKSSIAQFEYYKLLGEKAMSQVPDDKLFWTYNEESNSIGTIVKHLWGNMLSRWTDLFTSDGEKEWRDREAEFTNEIMTRQELYQKWDEGWKLTLDTLRSLTEADLEKIVYIRNQGHTVMDAINRQLAHYPYHVGQIVLLAKMSAAKWDTLTIPRGQSKAFNAQKFSRPKRTEHFTAEILRKHLTRDEAKERLIHAHEQLWAACLKLPEPLQTMNKDGKWSPVQHVQHINKGSGAYGQYLQADKQKIMEKFGVADHPSISYDELFTVYKNMLAGGAVSTARFIPETTDAISLSAEIKAGKEIVDNICNTLARWTDDELDKYVCPHPILGKLSAREMLYFTIIHAEHHTRPVEAELGTVN